MRGVSRGCRRGVPLADTQRMKAVLVAIALSTGCYVVHHAGGQCPTSYNGGFGDTIEGSACDVDQLCFVRNEFSPCMSAWYRCDDGVFHLDHGINAKPGAACVDSPLATCSYEGMLDCNAAPAAQICGCTGDGTWSCICACYDALSECGSCPTAFDPALQGIACGPIGSSCAFATGQRCDCIDDGNGDTFGVFHCT